MNSYIYDEQVEPAPCQHCCEQDATVAVYEYRGEQYDPERLEVCQDCAEGLADDQQLVPR